MGARCHILTDTDILATDDILDYGGGSSGVYYPSGTYLDLGYVANASVAMTYQPTGIPVGQDILTVNDILSTPDMLGSASTSYIDVYPQINVGGATSGDLYSDGDLYDPTGWYAGADLYELTATSWSGFKKFSPGSYQGQYFDFAMVLDTHRSEHHRL